MNIKKVLINKAKKLNKTIIFPEASFSERVRLAGDKMAKMGLAQIVFVGSENEFSSLNKNIKVYDPNNCAFIEDLIAKVMEERKHKGITKEDAKKLLQDPIYFAVTLTACGYADGMVCGAEVPTADTLRPALQIIKSKSGLVSSYFLFVGKNRVTDDVFMMGDCAVVENPSQEEQATIANLLLEENKNLNLFEPRFAFLSYSTYGSAKSDSITKVQNAYKIFTEQNPSVKAVGEVQFDASVIESVAQTKIKNKPFEGPANMFIMPNINAGNICYKMVQYFAGISAIGPITMGFKKPVNDLSRGCSVEDIILVTAITAIQCGKQ